MSKQLDLDGDDFIVLRQENGTTQVQAVEMTVDEARELFKNCGDDEELEHAIDVVQGEVHGGASSCAYLVIKVIR